MTEVVKKDRVIMQLQKRVHQFDFDKLDEVLASLDLESIKNDEVLLSSYFGSTRKISGSFGFIQDAIELYLSAYQEGGFDGWYVTEPQYNNFEYINPISRAQYACAAFAQNIELEKFENAENLKEFLLNFLVYFHSVVKQYNETFKKYMKKKRKASLVEFARTSHDFFVDLFDQYEEKVLNKVKQFLDRSK